jgi:hypothetical protein
MALFALYGDYISGMSDPLSDTCRYCGSSHVMDDAWWCEAPACWDAYYAECEYIAAYMKRTPLTGLKAQSDIMMTRASVWGPPAHEIELAASQIARLAHLPVH